MNRFSISYRPNMDRQKRGRLWLSAAAWVDRAFQSYDTPRKGWLSYPLPKNKMETLEHFHARNMEMRAQERVGRRDSAC